MSFVIGQRVRVNLKEIPEAERNCDVGQIVGINLFHKNTPIERVNYLVSFDAPYLKKEFVYVSNIKRVHVPESMLEAIE